MNIAFVTSADYRDLTDDDHRAVNALAERGATVLATVWNDASVNWDDFDCIVLRSTWDYHRNAAQFREWIATLEAMGAPLWNPPGLLLWNMEKTYLRDLELAGVRTVPTEWLERGTGPDIRALMDERGWHDAVVKPVVSAAANRTHRIGRSEVEDSRADVHADVAASLEMGDVMVQPFIPEIQTRGEWSLIFVDGEFSHSVRKTPMSGDFRVQAHLGGDATTESANGSLIASARDALNVVQWPWLYARVDGIETADGFILLELEMLEPSLYFAHTETGAQRFAEAVLRCAGAR